MLSSTKSAASTGPSIGTLVVIASALGAQMSDLIDGELATADTRLPLRRPAGARDRRGRYPPDLAR